MGKNYKIIERKIEIFRKSCASHYIYHIREENMMIFKETFFPYFKDFCIEKFGIDKGMQLFEKSELS
jgi:hypothetical protein